MRFEGIQILTMVVMISAMEGMLACQGQAGEAHNSLKIERVQLERPHERIAITGVRLTQGGAVECPKVRDDNGVIHAVSYLSPRISIGERVSLRGFYAITTRCRGKVLVVEE